MVRVDAEDTKTDVRVYAKVTRIAVSVDDYCLEVCPNFLQFLPQIIAIID